MAHPIDQQKMAVLASDVGLDKKAFSKKAIYYFDRPNVASFFYL